MKIFLAFATLLCGFVFASAQTEQAPIQEKELNYKNWTYKNVRGDGETNLRDFAKGKKLVMVVYFAPWCPNWKHEAPFAQKMYEKYKANGFEVIGVGEYDTVEKMKAHLDAFKLTFPVVYESDSTAEKQKTSHYEYRKAVGDTRNWGSPWNIFIEPALLEKKGDILLKKAFIVNGELIEPEAEKFIRAKLGLPAEDKKEQTAEIKSIETCDPEKKIAVLKQPE
ncbi:MAG TPA: redoxin domain-containing protein [Pyrinomonadaceae bacterium]|jgi:thiol-disulfide isomerase/thioredoxin